MEPTVFHWWVFSNNLWEKTALTRLIEGLGWTASQIDGFDVPASSPSSKPTAMVAGISSENLRDGLLLPLVAEYPDIPLAIFLRDGVNEILLSDLPSNVMATITPDLDETVVRSSLLLVAAGHRVMPSQAERPEAFTKNPRDYGVPQGDGGSKLLTNREEEISQEICKGKSDKEIAFKLGITVNTVNVHVSSIRRKFGVKNRTLLALRYCGIPTTPKRLGGIRLPKRKISGHEFPAPQSS